MTPPQLLALDAETRMFRPQPRLGCWELVSTSYNGGLDAEKEACLYVGDAAGRPKQGTYKKVTRAIRHSSSPCSDETHVCMYCKSLDYLTE